MPLVLERFMESFLVILTLRLRVGSGVYPDVLWDWNFGRPTFDFGDDRSSTCGACDAPDLEVAGYCSSTFLVLNERSRIEPNRTEPSRAEPNRAEPSRVYIQTPDPPPPAAAML